MSIFVTGDTHGARIGNSITDGFMPRLNTLNFPIQKELTKEDYVIICGDFGGIWDTNRSAFKESSAEKWALDWLESKSFTTLVVLGNHENYDRIMGIKDENLLNSWLFEKMPPEEKEKFKKGYPQKEWNGGLVRVLRPSVLVLESGVFTIDNKKILVYNGARSHDIQDGILNPFDFDTEEQFKKEYKRKQSLFHMFRVKGISWWEQELSTKETEKKVLKNLETVNNKVDYIFTHDCSSSIQTQMWYSKRDQSTINVFLQKIEDTVEFKHWFFGHYHGNKTFPGGQHHLLYDNIVQIM